MSHLRWLILVLSIIAASLGMTIAAAPLASADTRITGCGAPICHDGYIHAIDGANGDCQWLGNAPTWGRCTNAVEEVVNGGDPCNGCDRVNLYWGSDYTGAWACINPQVAWLDAGTTHATFTFDHGSGALGYGEAIWNNIASSKWVGSC